MVDPVEAIHCLGEDGLDLLIFIIGISENFIDDFEINFVFKYFDNKTHNRSISRTVLTPRRGWWPMSLEMYVIYFSNNNNNKKNTKHL